MSDSEFIIWLVESKEKIKEEHPEYSYAERIAYLKKVAEIISKKHLCFFSIPITDILKKIR